MPDDLKNWKAPSWQDTFKILTEYEIAVILIVVFGILIGIDLFRRFV